MTLRDTIDEPPLYFDRDGKPISFKTWVEHFSDFAYRCVAERFVENYRIITLWTGTTVDARGEPPGIYSTSVMRDGLFDKHYSEVRTATAEQALDVHNRTVEKVIASLPAVRH